MERAAAAFLTFAGWAVIAVALTGCAGVSFTPGDRVDNTRLMNALEADDVSYVRGACRRAR